MPLGIAISILTNVNQPQEVEGSQAGREKRRLLMAASLVIEQRVSMYSHAYQLVMGPPKNLGSDPSTLHSLAAVIFPGKMLDYKQS